MNMYLNNYHDEDNFTRWGNIKMKLSTIWKVIFSKNYLFFDVMFEGAKPMLRKDGKVVYRKKRTIIYIQRYRLYHNGVGKTLQNIGQVFIDTEKWQKQFKDYIKKILK